MGVPSASDFQKWDGSNKFDNTDWDANVDKIVEITANGNFDLNVNKVTAAEYVGVPSDQFTTLNAGENLTAGNLVRINGGQLFKADNTSLAGITSVVGVCNTTVSSGNPAKVDYGFYGLFSGLTAGTLYYVGTGGGLTSTRPPLYPLEVGYAVSTTRINLIIKEPDHVNVTHVVDELILPYDPDRHFTSTSYTRLFDYESSPAFGTNCRWDRSKIGKYSVYMQFAMTGALGSPYEMAIRFIKSDSTVVFDTGDLYMGNQGFEEMTWGARHTGTGNTTDLDLSTTILNGINWGTSGGYVPWEPQIRVEGASGGVYIKYLSLILVRSE